MPVHARLNLKQRLIGLTGGIGTGKTTVAQYLAVCHGLSVLDADQYAREAVRRESPLLGQLATRYGQQILLPDGDLNRSALGNIIFNNVKERQWVEQLIHPVVRQCFERDRDPQAPVVVMVIPLLYEAQMTDMVTEVWVVSCPAEIQLQRVMARDRLPEAAASARIDSQMPLAQKCELADVVLENSGDRADLYQQIDRALAGPHS